MRSPSRMPGLPVTLRSAVGFFSRIRWWRGAGRPNVARWSDLSRREQHVVGDYIRDVVGIDVAGTTPRLSLPPQSLMLKWLCRLRVARQKARSMVPDLQIRRLRHQLRRAWA